MRWVASSTARRGKSSGRGTNRSVPSSAPGRDAQPLTDIQLNSSICPRASPLNPSRTPSRRVAAIHADPHGHARRRCSSPERRPGVEHGETQRPVTGLGHGAVGPAPSYAAGGTSP